MTKEYKENLKKGKEKELSVEKYFKNKGYKTKMNTFYDENGKETFQSIEICGENTSYPDIEIEKTKNNIIIKYLVEVKSMNRIFKQGYFYGAIHCYQFEDYKDVQRHIKIPVHIIFVFYEDGFNDEEWYTDTLDNMNKTKEYSENLFMDDEYKHFIWDVSKLKRIK